MGNCTGKHKKESTGASPEQVEITTKDEPSTARTQQRYTNEQPSSSPTKKKVHPPLPKVPTAPEPSSPTSGAKLFIALFDYDARTPEDLTFKKGEYLEVRPENTQYDWWQATSRSTRKEGYIPSNYVAEVKTLEAEE